MGNHFLTLSLLLVTVCFCVSLITTKLNPREAIVSVSSDSEIPTEIHRVKILRQASDTKLAQLGVASWPKWEGVPSKFPWDFKKTETMYFVEGKIKVNVDGYDKEEETFEIGKGDVVVFPKGMKVVWEITEVKILRQVLDTKLAQLDYTSWTKWEGDPSTFPWTFEKTENVFRGGEGESE